MFFTVLGHFTHNLVVDTESKQIYMFCNKSPNTGYGFVLLQDCYTGSYKFIKALEVVK